MKNYDSVSSTFRFMKHLSPTLLRRVVLAVALLVTMSGTAGGRDVTVWMSPGGPRGIWEKTLGDPFPVKKLVEDLSYVGVTEILFFEQEGRGGPFLHPTTVEHAKTSPYMKGRDYLRELLEETAKHNMKVWLAWTTPSGKYPGADFEGLNHPAFIKLYCGEIEEVARNYGKLPSLAGVMWHEVDCSEAVDRHQDDVAEFAEFCRREFGEKYGGDKMPAVDPQDRWWWRHFLYRCHVVNELVRQTGAVARKHGLKTHFCSYAPETYAGASWAWGYDVVALEKLCDRQWFSGYSVESGKPYQHVRGACLDFGISYRGQNLGRNYAYAMHGRPVSYFEYRSPVYLDEMRRYYTQVKGFTEKHGDFYTGYLGRQQKELDLFCGKENVKRWLDLAARWQGGRSAAPVAVAVHPNAFVMKHPLATGSQYNQKVRSLMSALTACTDVDGLLLESRFALDPQNLRDYSLIIIPEDMGSGLSQAMVTSLKRYVASGGKLLVIATPLTTARRDLTDEKDLTREFCGVEITGPGLAGYVATESGGKFWSGSVKSVRLRGADVVLKRGATGEPLLVRNGGVHFVATGCSEDAAPFLAQTAQRLLRLPVTLADNSGLRILEGVVKDDVACFSLWGTGKATLRLDSRALGLGSATLRARDAITGATLGDFTSEQLAAGVPVEIKHPCQPFVCVIGAKDAADAFRGLYPSADVFAGMKEKESLDDPEVPREALGEKATASASPAAVAARTGPRDKEIGVLDYARKFEVKSKRDTERMLQSRLQMIQQAGLTPETVDADIFLPQNRATRNRYKRLFIPGGSDWFTQAAYEGMAEYVRDGGLLITCSGLLLLDANANRRADEGEGITEFSKNGFLGVRAHAGATMRRLKVLQSCPLTAGLATDGWITLETPLSGRDTLNRSAEVVIISDRTKRDQPDGEQPFLTYKHTGRGACIYLVGQTSATPDKTFVLLLKNICSPATLDWLCAP
ncbi:MAG: hypothetical protein NTY01_18055 [Verrucomicrobia bacterium]|nr:hypothetical protein [Verrucomicrobiota bacterium]